MAVYLNNSFSLGMLVDADANLEIREMSVSEAALWAADPGVKSVVGHANTAALYAKILGVPVAMNRASVKLEVRDQMVIGQYTGPRLAEGVVELPEGATIRWLHLRVRKARDFTSEMGRPLEVGNATEADSPVQ